MPKLSVGPAGIRKTISKIDPLEAIFEYVWNGFDAGATKIEINYRGELGGLSELSIEDNGTGINYNDLGRKFGVFLDSEKSRNTISNKRHNSEVRGKRGYGRLTFDVFCSDAKWDTVYEEGQINKQYQINISKLKIDEYIPAIKDGAAPQTTTHQPGTKVSFTNIYGLSSTELDEILARELAIEYCWFLELNKANDYQILVNGKPIDYEFMVSERAEETWVYRPTNIRFDMDYVAWSEKPNDEFSRFYYLNSENKEVFTETTKFNKKGDNFYNSIYISSSLFDDFDFVSPEEGYNDLDLKKSRRSQEYRFLQENVLRFIDQKRKPFLEQRSIQIVKELEIAEAFPKYDKSDPISVYQHNELVTLVREIYQVDPQIFSQLNKDQKRVFVRFLDLILQSGERDRLFTILDEVVGLSPESRQDLSTLLKTTKLQNIIQTVKMLEDRYRAVEDLKQLVFKNDWDVYEVKHIQAFIDKHYWILGEQYRLITSTEPDFEVALSRFQHFLYDTDKELQTSEINHPDKNKEMDIFAVKKDIWDDKIQSIVVELKRPKVNIGRKQLNQIETYMEVITSTPEFNDSQMSWEFHLIGRNYDQYVSNRLESEKTKGEPHLVMSAKNFKIYVKTWSEVIGAFERRHNFLMEMMDMERKNLRVERTSPDQAIEAQVSNTAAALPEYVPSTD